MPNMEYENLPLNVLVVFLMFLSLGKNVQKVPMKGKIT
jgi:hypothetical protein